MNIAIPKQNKAIATCFDSTQQFEIIHIENDKKISSTSVRCYGSEGFQRVRLLRIHEINTLICNGIKRFYHDQLLAIGINVIPNINDSIENALSRFLKNQLNTPGDQQKRIDSSNLVSHDELTQWALKLFKENGYSVTPCLKHDSSLIDLVATIFCPVCHKIIEVAICCGAQIYRVDREIQEFHHIAKTRYNARVYVYLTNPQVAKSCDEYGINFISPEMSHLNNRMERKSKIPILQKPIEGHEKAFNHKEKFYL
jgi:predicted Fe-Mo cluster-binding NifX family protein